MILLACAAPSVGVETGADTEAEATVTCPPPEPQGVEPGDYVEDLELTTCEGAARGLHDLCGEPALLVNWYGWCPSCEDNAALARELSAELQAVVVLVEDPLAEAPTGGLCADYEAAYPSEAEVWLDPAGVMARLGTTDLVLVLTAEGAISFVHETSNEDAIRRAVEEVTGDVASSP